jgi:hypothetical protein
MDNKAIAWEGMDYINLAHDGDTWLALVNMVMNLRVAQIVGSFLTS